MGRNRRGDAACAGGVPDSGYGKLPRGSRGDGSDLQERVEPAGPAAPVNLYLGLDSSTQSLSAIVLAVDGDRAHVVFESSLQFDDALPRYGTRHGVLPSDDLSVAVSPPLMLADALDVMLGRLAASGLDLRGPTAIAGR